MEIKTNYWKKEKRRELKWSEALVIDKIDKMQTVDYKKFFKQILNIESLVNQIELKSLNEEETDRIKSFIYFIKIILTLYFTKMTQKLKSIINGRHS